MKFPLAFRKFTVLLTLATMSLTVMNCSKKDKDNDPAPSQIVGNWKFTNFYVKEGNSPEVDQFPILIAFLPCFKDIVITFNANGTVSGSVPAACQSDVDDVVGDITQSKYELNGNQLILTDSDGQKTTMNVTFSGNTMSWTESETSGGITTTTRIVMTKQ